MWTNTIWTQRFEKITPKWTNVSWKGTILKGKNVIFQPKASNGIRQFSGGVINCGLKSNVPSSRKTKIICLQHFLPSRKAVVSSQSQCYHHCQSSLSDPAQKARSLLSICQTVWYIYLYVHIYNSLTISQRYPARVGYSNCLVLLIKCRPVKPPNNHPTKTWNFQRTFSFKASWKMKK